ncbi:MAG: pyridoxal-phosphate dependent enzyme, partial [Planctomycetes bacterium]|nr:pyridoxal-phosphate dependent enzyme [Planctomycetota bacterium]
MGEVAYQKCIGHGCGAEYSVRESYFACPKCGDLLDVRYRWDQADVPPSLDWFERRWAERRDPLSFSGVWRFRELMPFARPDDVITVGEGQTILQQADRVAPFAGIKPGRLHLQYEGLNPSGSFKDNGMTAAFTHANLVGAKRAACASTGNTSASMAVYAAINRTISGLVFVGSGKIAYGKLAQALDYGVATLQLLGDFDACMARVQEVATRFGIYLMNSLNPFRLEGQKAIMYRVLEALRWQTPDWIVVPGGNLGNSSAFGKAFMELQELGLINKPPRIAIINASGADTLYRVVNDEKLRWNG